ncbi:MAG: helix-turn-helix transcriptional regulator [Euryarchaeota archaeon]|nr:helix-turn-helix transcriptional regulator [Euryarchaeota archaeon]
MALKHIFGETPVVKILDFLIDHKGYEYSKTEIAENSDIAWTALNGHWALLVEWEFVKESRRIGNETLYKLNEENTMVRKLLEFDHEAAVYMSERIVEKETAIEKVHRVTTVEAIKIHG